MSQWGTFRDDDGHIHVAPALPDGRLALNHSKHEYCQCGPRADQLMQDCGGDVVIWVHQDPERGGYDS